MSTHDTSPGPRPSRSAGASLALIAGIAGWLSYASVRSLAVTEMGPIAGSAFPLILDAAVLASSQYYLSSARINRPQHGYKMLTRALIVATIAINGAAAHDWRGILVHVIPPMVFAALVELRARQVLGDARAEHGRPDRIPLKLWVTSPLESFRLSLWVARQGSFSAQRSARERQLTALEALRIAVPSRKGDGGRAKTARGLVARQLKAGSLDPRALVEATGLDALTPTPGAEAVLRVALISALGAPQVRGTRRTGAAQSAGTGLVLPTARRTRGPENPNPGRSIEELQDEALQLHQAAGKPLSLRAIKSNLNVGQDRAVELRDWLAAQPVTHANGHTLTV
jgi:hypothetical protein